MGESEKKIETMYKKKAEPKDPAESRMWDEILAKGPYPLRFASDLKLPSQRVTEGSTASQPNQGQLIAPEQVKERDLWDQRLASGACNLRDALMMTLHIGVPASADLVGRCEAAFMGYDDGHCNDLAINFGCAISQREKKAEGHQTIRMNIKFHVKGFSGQGYPLLNPNNHPDKESAFTKAAALLANITASTAFEIYYDRDIKKKKTQS